METDSKAEHVTDTQDQVTSQSLVGAIFVTPEIRSGFIVLREWNTVDRVVFAGVKV
jgi:hypothetical protein